jgi:putative DNA methylase
MIERWFPCAEVSEASASGWGSGKSEKALFTWFAARPLAQAKAAVITSLLPWPENQVDQRRLQDLVRRSLTGRDAAHDDVVKELEKHYPDGARLLDPFSGRAIIPLEAARLGVVSEGIDYSPVAAIGGRLLADYPLRDWDSEPDLPFPHYVGNPLEDRLVQDVASVLDEVGNRYERAMRPFYPKVGRAEPWGSVWALTLPCQECGIRFPLVGSLILRHPSAKKKDPGQSFSLAADRASGKFYAVVQDGAPSQQPTRVVPEGKSKYDAAGKVAICLFCDYPHSKAVQTRLARMGMLRDALLLAADLDETVGKTFRVPTPVEFAATEAAEKALAEQVPFGQGLPAVPDELIPPANTWTVQPVVYGAKTYGDLCNARQTLGFVELARAISGLSANLLDAGLSLDYVSALTGYATAVMVRKFRRATRGVSLMAHKTGTVQTTDLFRHEGSITFSYDYFEAGLGEGPGTWRSLCKDTLVILRNQAARSAGRPANISWGTATDIPHRKNSLDAVVTDPPYDSMIEYLDASDLFFVWMKRALCLVAPELQIVANEAGVQDKTLEAIVRKSGGSGEGEHRNQAHYDASVTRAFSEAARAVSDDGVVSIVFGHGDPDVWHRLLRSVATAGLVLTGSWPARTEVSTGGGSANIVTTLTMACRRAPAGRPDGRAHLVEAQVRKEVKARIPMWDATGLAPTDQLMASAGPAMEAVGRYEQVLNHLGDPVDPSHYLVVARRAVEEAASVVIDHLPLETFDVRTRFALSWARLYRRSVAPKSEARWQALAADLSSDELKGVLQDADKGVRLGYAKDWKGIPTETSATIDVAMAMAQAWPDGLDTVAEVLVATGRDTADNYLWAAIGYLSSLLPEADPDAVAWTSLVRGRGGIGAVTRGVVSARREAADLQEAKNRQGSLFDTSWQEAVSETRGEPAQGDAKTVVAEESK